MSWVAVGVAGVGLAAGAAGSIMGAGKKPKIPAFTPVDPGASQREAISGNIQSFADVSKLATQVNTLNQDELNRLLEKAFPGAREKVQGVIGDMLGGQIPEGTLQQLRRSAAERGVAAGTVGGGFQLGRELGSQLGLSLELTQRGLDSAQRWLQQSVVPQFNAATMFLSPSQVLDAQVQQRIAQTNQDTMRAQVKAQPDPTMAAMGGFLQSLGGMAFGAGTSGALGGGFGGGGAGMGGNPNVMMGNASGAFGPGDSSWFSRVGNYGFGNNWYLGSRPGRG